MRRLIDYIEHQLLHRYLNQHYMYNVDRIDLQFETVGVDPL